jgi:D-tyrosyl-tRNA(Tyr) deacylase
LVTLIQRVARAEVRVGGVSVGSIGQGILLFVGVQRGDRESDADATARKVCALRIFAGRAPMDLSVKDVGGACLVVSQFTLAGSIQKGNRPSFDRAEDPPRAEQLYDRVAAQIAAEGVPVAKGRFAATMEVDLINDGPVTFVIEARDGALVKTPP